MPSAIGQSRLAVDRRVEREHVLLVAEQTLDVGDRLAEQVRDVLERRIVPAGRRVRLEVAQRAQHHVELLHDVRGQADRARLVHDRALDRLPDPPRRVGGEAEAALGIELLERMDEAQVAFLDQVGQRDAAMRVMAGDADDEAQVALDHRLPRREVARRASRARSAAPRPASAARAARRR